MSACRTDGDAFVAYYGVGIDGLLNEQHAIGKPVLLHVPTADGFVPPDVQRNMHEGLKDNRHVTLHDYEGLDHGRSEEHTSELQSLMRISYAVFCLKKKIHKRSSRAVCMFVNSLTTYFRIKCYSIR